MIYSVPRSDCEKAVLNVLLFFKNIFSIFLNLMNLTVEYIIVCGRGEWRYK